MQINVRVKFDISNSKSFLRTKFISVISNYKKEDFEQFLKGEKIDVILDMVGGDYTQKNLEILNEQGRLIYINGMKSMDVTINLRTIMSKNLIVTGSFLKPQSVEVKAQIAKEVEKNIWPLFN
ncbi:putative NAD(P)H quinone oxidoreductase, PIG3 family [Flavobacterium sp. TAB 87]|nr:putative NAD(P)H quinone oxidoreductase, PIG3 family [Flavobacterium sp. TAB 87]